MDARLKGFILFCIERRGNQWPGLYDEMAKVASAKLYLGMGYADLHSLGLSLSLDGIGKTRSLVDEAVNGREVPAKPENARGVASGIITPKPA